jgi:hypothetical protein
MNESVSDKEEEEKKILRYKFTDFVKESAAAEAARVSSSRVVCVVTFIVVVE